MSTRGGDVPGDNLEALSASASIAMPDGRHRLAMLATVPGSHIVVWTYTLTSDLVGTDDDVRHEFAHWSELRAHFAGSADVALITELLAECGQGAAGT